MPTVYPFRTKTIHVSAKVFHTTVSAFDGPKDSGGSHLAIYHFVTEQAEKCRKLVGENY